MSTPSEEELVRAAAVAHNEVIRLRKQAACKRQDALIRAQQAAEAQMTLRVEMQKLKYFQQLQLRQQLPLRHVAAQQATVTGLQQKVAMIAAAQFQLANDARKLKQQEVAEQARFRQLHIQLAALRRRRVVATTSNEVQLTAKPRRGTKRSRMPPSPKRGSSPPQPPTSKKPRVSSGAPPAPVNSGAPPAPDRKSSSNDPEPTAATSNQPCNAWVPNKLPAYMATVEKAMNSALCEHKEQPAPDEDWTPFLLRIGFEILSKTEMGITNVTRVLAVLFKMHPDVQPATTRRFNPDKMSIHLLHQDFLYALEFETGVFTSIEAKWERYCLSRNLYETVESMTPEKVAEQMKGLYSGSPAHIRYTLLHHCANILVHRIMEYRNRARKSFDATQKRDIDKLCQEHEQVMMRFIKRAARNKTDVTASNA